MTKSTTQAMFQDELQKEQGKHATAIDELNKLHDEKLQELEGVNTNEVQNKLDDVTARHESLLQETEHSYKQSLETERDRHKAVIQELEEAHMKALEAEKEKQSNLIKSHEKTVGSLKGEIEVRRRRV